MALKFYWNGIKDNGGRLQRCFYSDGQLAAPHMPGTLTIYARDYWSLSAGVRQAFKVQNDSDPMTDYFETDMIRVPPSHPLYGEVLRAFNLQVERQSRRARRQHAQRQVLAETVQS